MRGDLSLGWPKSVLRLQTGSYDSNTITERKSIFAALYGLKKKLN